MLMTSVTTERLKMQSKASNELFKLFGSGKSHELEKLAVYGASRWLELNPSAKEQCHYLAEYLAKYGEDNFFFDSIVNKNRYARVTRLKERVSTYVKQDYGFFITLTFRDNVLAETNPSTRRKYVQRWCNKWLNSYVANIDFGGKNGREHYHCIGDGETYLDDKFTFRQASNEWFSKYGAVQIKRIRPTMCKDEKMSEDERYQLSITRTCKYVSKLTSHAIKESTGKAWNLLYSADGCSPSTLKKYTHNWYLETNDFDEPDWSHWDDVPGNVSL